jgi:hypothetical protein
MRLIEYAFSFGPVLFGIAFLAPLIAAICGVASIEAPLGLSPIHFGLALGAMLGLIARQRRTWLW